MSYYTYILTTKHNKSLYIGVTNDLDIRVKSHKEGKVSSSTRKYNINKLVYYEEYDYIEDAIEREKQLKNWHRDWKLNLILGRNPKFADLLQ